MILEDQPSPRFEDWITWDPQDDTQQPEISNPSDEDVLVLSPETDWIFNLEEDEQSWLEDSNWPFIPDVNDFANFPNHNVNDRAGELDAEIADTRDGPPMRESLSFECHTKSAGSTTLTSQEYIESSIFDDARRTRIISVAKRLLDLDAGQVLLELASWPIVDPSVEHMRKELEDNH